MEIAKARYRYSKGLQKPRRFQKFVFVFLACLLLFSSGGYTYAALSKQLPEVQVASNELSIAGQEVALAWPSTGQAAVGSLNNGILASSTTSEEAKPIASMTKLVTALAVLQKAPMDPGESGKSYILDSVDAGYFSSYLAKGGSVVPAKLGDTITQDQALHAMLIISANNMADSLVRWNFGSMDAYVAFANDLVKSYGLQHTIITDASGFSPQTVSTPSDMIVLGQKALANPIIASIVTMREYQMPGVGLLKNSNRLLSDGTVIGLKTGTTDEAGYCVLFAATRPITESHTETIIGVVMGAKTGSQLYAESRALLEGAFQGFGVVEVATKGAKIGTVATAWGEQSDIVAADTLSLVTWKGKPLSTQALYETIKPEVSAGQTIGALTLAGSPETKVDLVANSSISAPGKVWRLRNYF